MTSIQFTFQLPKFFFLIQKKPWTPTTNPEHTHALDRSAIAPLVCLFIGKFDLDYLKTGKTEWAEISLYLNLIKHSVTFLFSKMTGTPDILQDNFLPHVEVDNMTSIQFTFQLPKFFFLIQKKPWTPTTNPEHTHALDRSAIAPLVCLFIGKFDLDYLKTGKTEWAEISLYLNLIKHSVTFLFSKMTGTPDILQDNF